MRNFFRVSKADDVSAGSAAWHQDPLDCFAERYYDASGPTPFVKVTASSEQVLWDLSFAGHGPDEADFGHVNGLVLQADGKRVECASRRVRASYPVGSSHAILTIVPLEHLTKLELTSTGTNASHVKLVIIAVADDVGESEAITLGALNASFTFTARHQPLLQSFCGYVESVCGRKLTTPATPAARPPDVPREPVATPADAPDAAQWSGPEPVRADTHPTEPGAGPLRPPARNAVDGKAVPEEMRDHHAGRQTGPRPAFTRAGDHLLAVSPEFVPDSAEWLSFAAPTIEELMSSGPSAGECPGGSEDDHYRGSGTQHTPEIGTLPNG